MYNREYLVCGTCASCGLLSHLSHVGVSMCVGCPMSSTKRLKSLGHRCTPAPTRVVLFYDCLFDILTVVRGHHVGGPIRC